MHLRTAGEHLKQTICCSDDVSRLKPKTSWAQTSWRGGTAVTEITKEIGSGGLPGWLWCHFGAPLSHTYVHKHTHAHTHTHPHTHSHLSTHLYGYSITVWTNKQLQHAGLPGALSCQAFVYPPFSVSGSVLLAWVTFCALHTHAHTHTHTHKHTHIHIRIIINKMTHNTAATRNWDNQCSILNTHTHTHSVKWIGADLQSKRRNLFMQIYIFIDSLHLFSLCCFWTWWC